MASGRPVSLWLLSRTICNIARGHLPKGPDPIFEDAKNRVNTRNNRIHKLGQQFQSIILNSQRNRHSNHDNERDTNTRAGLYGSPVCSMVTSIKSPSSNPRLSAVSSRAMRSPSTMKRTYEAGGPSKVQYLSMSFERGLELPEFERHLSGSLEGVISEFRIATKWP